MNQIFEQIKTIDFDSSQYGKDLNERLQKIDSNFQKIITTDYLKGAPGENIAIYEWVIGKELEIELYQSFNDNRLWSDEDLYQNLQEAISNNYSNDSLISLNSIHWYDDLIGSSMFLIYQTDQNDKKVIISSLPYIYIDSRFKYIGQPNFENNKYSELEDISCTIQFQTGLETGSGFKTIHNFPTIYYDTEISNGSLCWKINNKFTGIPCQGPKGKDGSNGQTYLAYISTTSENNLYEIYGVFGIQDNSYKIIPVEKFQDNNIQLKEGDSIICFFARDLGNGQYAPISPEQGEDKFITYMISNVHVSVDQTTDQKYFVYGGEQICTVNLMANLTNFSTLLEEIGKTSGMLSCLFVPNLVNQNYHAFWSDNQGDKVHIGLVNNTNNCTDSVSNSGVLVNHYSMIENPIGFNIKSNQLNIESDTERLEINLPGNPVRIKYDKDISMEPQYDASINIKGSVEIDSKYGFIRTSAQNNFMQSSQTNNIYGGQNVIIGGVDEYPNFEDSSFEPNAENNFYGSCHFSTFCPGYDAKDKDITFQTENGSISISEIIKLYKSRSEEFQIHQAPVDTSFLITLNEEVKKHIITGYNDSDEKNDSYEFDLEKIRKFINHYNWPSYSKVSSIHYILENRSGSNIDLYFNNENWVSITGYGDNNVVGKYNIISNYLNRNDYSNIEWDNGLSTDSYSPKCGGVKVLECKFLQPSINNGGQNQWPYYQPIGNRYTIPNQSIIDIYITFTCEYTGSDIIADITLFSSSI